MARAEVIVVGAGVAGSVTAGVLARAGHRVLVVEAGPGWPLPPALASIDATEAFALDDRFSTDVSALLPAATGSTGSRTVPYRVGRGVGGSSAINAMVVTSGDRADYDLWATGRSCPGWGGAALAPWLARAAEAMGMFQPEPGPVARAWAAAARAAGHPEGGPSVALDARGVLAASLTARPDRRRSAADAHLRPEGRLVPGVELRAGAPVRRLVTSGGRVTGVELVDGEVVSAGLVVVCAGALVTPGLLMASGLVEPAGPGGGSGLGSGLDGRFGLGLVSDHPSFGFTLSLRPEARSTVGRAAAPITSLLRWSSGGPGGRPDLMALAMDHVGPDAAGRAHGAVIVTLTDVRSVGTLEGRPGGGVTVDPGWLADPDDRRRFRVGVRHVADLLAGGGLDGVAAAVHIDDRGTPLSHLVDADDAVLDRWLLDHPGPVRHAAATARMGTPGWPGAVVDLDGRPPGWDGVVVADASVLPHVPNGNPMLPVLAVAHRLAHGLARGLAP